MPTLINSHHHDLVQKSLLRRGQGEDALSGDVEAILRDVQTRGDMALRAFTQRFDGFTPQDLRLSREQIKKAASLCPSDVRDALGEAATRIRDFHQHTVPQDFAFTDQQGVHMGYRYAAMESAGVYVPGGKAAYPSSVLMNCLPALVAGVERLVVCTPTPEEYLNPAVMAALDILQLDEVYAIGGAQAIAAMAYGTESIAKVDFVAGPGNAYVAAAKRAVFGTVGIDSLAGPSEVTVVADRGADPEHVAWDLMAQAEHDAMAQSIVITDSAEHLQNIAKSVETILETLPRRAIAGASWREHGLMIQVADIADAASLVDLIAPEHLILSMANPEAFFATIRHAGSVFLGYHAPEAIGDYFSGPNHVLPTSGSARFASGLSCHSFMKHTSFQQLDAKALAKVASAAMILAEAEGLDAHRQSMAKRLD